MANKFDIDDLVWAKLKRYRPWPGRIIRDTIGLKRGKLCVQFYGNDDHAQVFVGKVYPYLDKVDEFTTDLPMDYDNAFYTAINTIHEKYWNLIDLKREREEMGFPVDTDEEIELALEDRKAGHWNPRILRRPLPVSREDEDDDDDDDPYPSPNWGRSKCAKFKKKTTCQNSKASTSSQSCKASTSGYSCKASTSKRNCKASTSGASVSFPLTKRQKSILLRATTQKTTGQSIEPSVSKVIKKETPQINNKKRKASVTLCLSDKDEKPSTPKKACSMTSKKETVSSEIYVSPFQHLSIPETSDYDIEIPQHSCTDCKIKFGFIGLKELSQSIIHPLLKFKHVVNVWSKDASKFNALSKAGAVRTNTPARIITSSDVIIYCSKDSDVSKNILFTREGVFDGCERSRSVRKIFVELTNIDVNEPDRNIRSIVKFQGGFYLQVKVITSQIEKRFPPTFICAGNLRAFAAVASCLRNVTDDIHYFGTEFFWDAPMTLTPRLTEELVLQSLQKTTAYLYELGFNISEFEKIICHKEFDFGKVAAKLKEGNEAERNKPIKFYQDM